MFYLIKRFTLKSSNDTTPNTNSVPIKMDAVSAAIWIFGSILGSTWRKEIGKGSIEDILENPGKGKLFAIWHSDLLPLAYVFRNKNFSVIVSSSRDGIRASAVAEKWNYSIIQGSSTRDGFSAYRQCIRSLQNNRNIAITTDGPKGPRGVVKSGIAHLCAMTKAPVLPIAIHPSKFWKLKSWDRMLIPKPFAKLTIKTGEIITSGNLDTSETSIELSRKKIEENLHAISLA
jgi:lysophospholipid acyltransferase (LPLAT)-like uncharacterized protein